MLEIDCNCVITLQNVLLLICNLETHKMQIVKVLVAKNRLPLQILKILSVCDNGLYLVMTHVTRSPFACGLCAQYILIV